MSWCAAIFNELSFRHLVAYRSADPRRAGSAKFTENAGVNQDHESSAIQFLRSLGTNLRVNPVIAWQPLANAPLCTAPGEATLRERGGIESPATFPFSQYVRITPNRALDTGNIFSHIAYIRPMAVRLAPILHAGSAITSRPTPWGFFVSDKRGISPPSLSLAGPSAASGQKVPISRGPATGTGCSVRRIGAVKLRS